MLKLADRAMAQGGWARFCQLDPDHAVIGMLVAASRLRALAVGEAMVEEGGDDSAVYLVVSGTLRTIRRSENGHEIWYADVVPGEIIGEIAALTGTARTSSVIARESVVALTVDGPSFLRLASAHAELSLALARMLAERVNKTSEQLAGLIALPLSSRLHIDLVQLGEPDERDAEVFHIHTPPTVLTLSERVHATREATSRALSELEQSGLVKRRKTTWSVLLPRSSGSI